MAEKHLIVIQDAIDHTASTIASLACENYPHTPFEDKDAEEMYYALVRMSLKLSEKIKEAI